MSAVLRTDQLRSTLGRLLVAALFCAAVAVPSAVTALDEGVIVQQSEGGGDSEWPAPPEPIAPSTI